VRNIYDNTKARLLVFVYRHNKLAQWVSYAELSKKAREEFWGAASGAPTKRLIDDWEDTCRNLKEAEETAAAVGMRVVKLDFLEIARDSCGAARMILRAWLHDVPETELETLECFPVSGHKTVHAEGLSLRVGASAADAVVEELTGTVYEWMLDLNATRWPHGHEDNICYGR